MASINKVILIGNLGRDPEVRYTPNGSAICNITIATSRNWKDKNTGDKVEETEWHRVVFYDRLAEVAGEYLKKGRPVYAENMQLLGGRDGGGSAGDDGGYSREERSEPVRSAPASRPAATKPAPKSSTGFDDMDDDIPF